MRERLLGARAANLMPSVIRQMSGRRRPTSIDMSIGQPSLSADRAVVDAAVAELHRGSDGYTDNAGLRPLRELVASYHRFEKRTAAENVIITVGSEEGVFLSLLAAIDPGDEVLVPEPSYPAYHGIVALAGGTPVDYPIEEGTLVPRAGAIASRINPRTRALVINSPSNPFGTIISADEMQAIARLCDEHGIIAVSDEVYAELVYGGARAPSIGEFTANALVVGGLSKSCAFCGYRLGWVIAESEFIKQAALAHQLIVTCAPRLAQLMAIEILRRPETLKAHVPFYEKARERLRLAAEELPSDAPMFLGDGAFYAILDVSKYGKDGSMALALELLEQEDVVVVPGIAFGPSGDWFWRISYAAGADAAGEGISRIARFLRRI